MFTPMQIILVCLWVGVNRFIGNSIQILAYATNVVSGFIVGCIMGDPTTGLFIGGTLTLMGLGIGGFGGSSVPDYALGTIMGTLFACTGSGVEAGLAIGVPVAMLGTQLDVLRKTIGSFFIHKAMSCNEKGDFKGMSTWIWLSEIPRVALYVLPVLLAMTAGAEIINTILEAIPAWVSTGMSVAGGILPGLGFAILMRYMNLGKYGVFMIVGFVLAAYVGMPMLAIAALGFVIAYMIYQNLLKEENAKANAVMGGAVAGGMEDE